MIDSANNVTPPMQENTSNAGYNPASIKPTTENRNSTYNSVDTIYGLPEVGNNKFVGELGTLDTGLYDYNTYDNILQIIPGDMNYNNSSTIINAFDFKEQVGEFQQYVANILSNAGVSSGSIPHILKFFITEPGSSFSLSNQYGENVLNAINNVSSSLTGDYAYMSNGNMDTFKKMVNNNLHSMFNDEMVNKIVGGVKSIGDMANNTIKHVTSGNVDMKKELAKPSVLKDLLAGYKIDLPKVWKNSTASISIGGKIRLMSAVDNNQAIVDRIIIPYVLLLALGTPRSTDKYLYRWPFVVNAKLPGHGEIELGVITDVNVTKGADSIITIDNKFIAIDINVTITPLYNTMFMTKGPAPGSMLTLNNEVKELSEYLLKPR